MPFEWIVALRFLREGRMQTVLILAGVTVGVAIIVTITALITGLQSSLIERTLGAQAHVVVRPPENVARTVLERSGGDIAALIENARSACGRSTSGNASIRTSKPLRGWWRSRRW